MQSSLWRWITRGALVAALATLIVACSPTKTGQVAEHTAAPAEVTRTPKPTFTPLPPTETVTLTPTQAPTLAPTATSKPAQAQADPSVTPSKRSESTPTEAPTATSTLEPPTPTAEPSTATPPPVQSARMASPEYGMQAFMWWRPEVASRDLQMIKAAGFGWVKVNFGWRDIEGAGKGVYDWSHTDKIIEMTSAENMKVLVRIDHQPQWTGGGFPVNGPPDNMQHLADFFRALAGRYRGKIHAYEVWNEPNLAREWGGKVPDPTGYVQMLKACYGAIKAADPNAIVVSAGLSPTGTWNEEARPDEWYLATMYELMPGGSRGYFDVLGAHAPGFKYAPETDPAVVAQDPHGQRAFCFRHVEDLRAIMVKYGDVNKQVAVLEFGWTSDPRADSPYNWHAVSEQTKADYFVRAYQYAKANWSPWIGLMSLIYICDPDWTTADEQYYWAISDPSYPDFKPRPAYTALKAMVK